MMEPEGKIAVLQSERATVKLVAGCMFMGDGQQAVGASMLVTAQEPNEN
jgi:hypothetical protein